MNEEVKVMKDDRGVEYKCLTYTSYETFASYSAGRMGISHYLGNRRISELQI